MTKDYFIKQIKEINNRIEKEILLKRKISDEYIKSNAKFNIGERVKIVTPPFKYRTGIYRLECITEHAERFAYVDGYVIESNGNVHATLKKEKKDGTISKQSDYYSESRDFLESLK